MEHARPPPELNMEGGPVSRADAWRRWRQQFLLFIKASGVDSENSAVQASLLINLIGPEGYKFFTRNQEEGESIQQYVTALRLISKKCAFLSLEEDLIKDRIVCGVRSATVRDRLLRHEDLTLEKAMNLCIAEETSQESGRQLNCFTVSGSECVQVNSVEQCRGSGGRRGRRAGGPSGRAPAPRRADGRFTPVHAAPCSGCGARVRCQQKQCPAQNATCFVCGKRGHFARVCKSGYNTNFNSGRVRHVYEIGEEEANTESDEEESFHISVITDNKSESGKWFEILTCTNGEENFKLDTGADINVISYRRFIELGYNECDIKNTNIKLEAYSGDKIPIKGTCSMKWVYKNTIYNLRFAIADNDCQSVLGRKSCELMKLVKRIYGINLTDYSDLFQGVGCLPGKYHIVVDNSIRPVVCASRKIPLGIRDRLLLELQKMEKLGIIRKVYHPTPWVHPLVIVAKKNNGIRICLDPRDLNRAVQRAHFQLPTVTELATRLHGACYFSVLDANSGFWAVQLDEESVDLCTFATPFGRYQFLRLPFGINCSSEVFHAKMRQLLEDLEGVDSFVDDIIVWGKTKREHDDRLVALLNRARNINLKFNKDKCKVGVEEVVYLGHVFDKNGMRPDYNKIKAIKEMPEPNDKKSLQRFLGAVNYLSKFIPNHSESALPLTNLLKKENEWRWEDTEQKSFFALKESVCRAPVLALYDVSRPLVLSVDASRDALGAVLLQAGRPVEYASRTLTDTQRRYAQIEKEMLAIVFACERFHQYIYGKVKILVETDHKPLESIFKKPLMSVPARLQRMLLRIQTYDLLVNYKPGKYMYVPDALSRAPLPELYSVEVEQNVLYQVQMVVGNIPISNSKLALIKKETKQDKILCALIEYIKTGWPDHKYNLPIELQVFWAIKDELYVVDSVVFKDSIILIPSSLRAEMLRLVHEGHLGIDRCKRRARQVMYWPNMSRDIESHGKRCTTCQESLNAQAKEPMIPVEIPPLPWTKVGTDIFENTPREGLSSPAQMLMSRRLRCKLPASVQILKPKLVNETEYHTLVYKQKSNKGYYDRHCKTLCKLEKGDQVICNDGKNRTRATVVSTADTPRSYIIENKIGTKYRRNRRHLIKCEPPEVKFEINKAEPAVVTKVLNQKTSETRSDVCIGGTMDAPYRTAETPPGSNPQPNSSSGSMFLKPPLTRKRAKTLK
ncbi:uncharacterized protein LOC128201708 [Galleria mellonella]|uniref:RNA-directed DNA polymerase n=1 Tax=Galleria mellonella TaxID=7137 RepID=A0ABM3MVJ3_GALME|nr:uncharacterized protein LOC128201708 [Galleria mellonella]